MSGNCSGTCQGLNFGLVSFGSGNDGAVLCWPNLGFDALSNRAPPNPRNLGRRQL